jgi:hypothetical protein
MIYLLFICNGSIVGGMLLVAALYSVLWGKNKKNNKTLPCNKVNSTDIGMQDEQEHEQMEEDNKGREEQKEATSAIQHSWLSKSD